MGKKAEEADEEQEGSKKRKNPALLAAHHERHGHEDLGHDGDAHEQVQHGIPEIPVDGVVDGRGEGHSARRGERDGDER